MVGVHSQLQIHHSVGNFSPDDIKGTSSLFHIARPEVPKKEKTTATPTKTSLPNIISRYLYCFAIIPIRPTCTMWPNYPATEQVRTAVKLRQRMKNTPSCAHVLHKTLNLVISRCCLRVVCARLTGSFF